MLKRIVQRDTEKRRMESAFSLISKTSIVLEDHLQLLERLGIQAD